MAWMTDDLPDSVYEQANAIRQAAEDQYAQIRSNGNLSVDGIRAAMAAPYLKAVQSMALLQATATDQAKNKRLNAMRAAFGNASSDPVAVVASRDAAARVAQIPMNGWREGDELMDQAILNNDESLARAIALKAYELGRSGDGAWGDVLDKFTSGRPAVQQAIATLENSQRPMRGGGQLFAFIVGKPSELGNLSQWEIEALAAGGQP